MKLSAYLKDNAVTPAAFAERIGVTDVTVYRWVAGSRRPRQRDISKITAATNGEVTANDFFAIEAAE